MKKVLLFAGIAFCLHTNAQTTTTFNYTGGVQTFTVPAGVNSINIDASGASGGQDLTHTASANGGRVQATMAVTAGQVLNIYVGGAGIDGSGITNGGLGQAAAGGYNGGGASGYYSTSNYTGGSGGGATDIRVGGTALGNRMLVAGGGGGSSYTDPSLTSVTHTQGYNAGNGVLSISYTVTPCAALNFNGSTNYVTIPDNASLNFGTGDFTAEVDFQSTVSQAGFAGLVVKDGASSGLGWQMVIVNNHIAAEFTDGSTFFGTGDGLEGNTTLTDGNWHHLAMVVSRSANTIYLYVDGNVDASLTNSAISTMNITNSSVPMLVGVERTYALYANGNIDEVRVWNIARTQCQLKKTTTCEISLADRSNLALYYKFNEGYAGASNSAVTSATDSTANNNTGTLMNFSLTGSTSNWVAPGAVTSGVSCGPIVYPTVNVTSATICAGTTATVTASGTATSYSWSTSETTASISPSPTVTANYTVTGADANNCKTSATSTVTVNQLPDVYGFANQAACNNTSTNAISFSSSISGTTFPWTNNNNSIGLASSGTGDIAAFTATNSGSSPVLATLAVTPAANNCNGSTQTFTITINPTPDVIVPSNQSVCNNANTASITFSSSVSGTTFPWTNNNSSIGLASSGTGDIAAFTATNSGSSPVLATLAVTPAANNCNGSTQTLTITINPTPTVTITASSYSICTGNTATLTASGASSYTWTSGPVATTYTVAPTNTTQYTVTGSNAYNCTNSDTLSIKTVNCTTGIAQNAGSTAQIVVYPNPNNGSFIVTTTENAETIVVTDVLGNALLTVTPGSTTTSINLGAQPNGIYFVKVIGNGTQMVKRIVLTN